MADPCPKCEALYEVLRQVAFADPDTLPRKIRTAYRDYRKEWLKAWRRIALGETGPEQETCGNCNGRGSGPAGEPCPRCDGGKVSATPAGSTTNRTAEALEPANQVLGAILSRWRRSLDEDTLWLPDIDCLSDDLSWGSDIVDDYASDLVHDGFVALTPDGTYVPTAMGAKHHAAL